MMTESKAETQQPAALQDGVSGTRPRILVVEDEKTSQEVLLAMLIRLGYSADLAVNGVDAVKALQHEDYDVVLMDCELPEMDGEEATRQIRSPHTGARNPNVPIIAYTSVERPGHQQKCLQAGMNDYLLKPVRMRDLAATLAKWCVG